MPRGDKTGPLGQGPMTGRAAGLCTGNSMPGFMNRIGFNMGFGAGMGRRRGRGRFFSGYNMNNAAINNQNNSANITTEQEIELLKQQSEMLSSQLENINKRLDEIKNEQ